MFAWSESMSSEPERALCERLISAAVVKERTSERRKEGPSVMPLPERLILSILAVVGQKVRMSSRRVTLLLDMSRSEMAPRVAKLESKAVISFPARLRRANAMGALAKENTPESLLLDRSRPRTEGREAKEKDARLLLLRSRNWMSAAPPPKSSSCDRLLDPR